MSDWSCNRVLVRGVNWVGDSIMTLPALHSLKKAIPEAEISLLVKPLAAPLFLNDPFIDETIVYEKAHESVVGKLKLSKMLSRKGFSCALLLQNAFDAALIAFLAGVRKRAGYARDGRRFLLTDPVPVPSKDTKEHQIYYYLNLLNKLGIPAAYETPFLYLDVEERMSARSLLGDIRRPVLGINPGATYGSAKRWFPERFAEVANWFIQDNGGSVVVFGSPAEVDIAEEIYLKLSPDFRNPENFKILSGKTSIRQLLPLISECDVFLTNDSGPLHIAYSVGTPTTALFGSTSPELTGPPPGLDICRSVVVAPDIPCRPCFKRTCKTQDLSCMYEILSDDVYLSIKKLIPDRRAVFFDRDGTLCEDPGYMKNIGELNIFDTVRDTARLKEKGFMLIGISNQSGIARGIIDEDFVREVNRIFLDRYSFDDFLYCPHHPDEHCRCRKPQPGMLLKARARYGTDFRKSYTIGDKEADMLVAKAAGTKAVLVQTGTEKTSAHADFVARDLGDAVRWILRDEEKQR